MRTGSCALAVIMICIGLLVSGVAAADKAPDFKLADTKSEFVQLSQVNAEHPVLVSFWATWCVPCPSEMVHLQRFYEKYQDRGFRVLGLAIDGTKSAAKVKPFIEGRRITFPILLDTNNDAKRSYMVKVVPTVYLLRPGGEIAYTHIGYRPGDEVALESEIQKVLAECAGAAATDSAQSTSAPADSAAPSAAEGETPSR